MLSQYLEQFVKELITKLEQRWSITITVTIVKLEEYQFYGEKKRPNAFNNTSKLFSILGGLTLFNNFTMKITGKLINPLFNKYFYMLYQ